MPDICGTDRDEALKHGIAEMTVSARDSGEDCVGWLCLGFPLCVDASLMGPACLTCERICVEPTGRVHWGGRPGRRN
jgi:hypothetical protein